MNTSSLVLVPKQSHYRRSPSRDAYCFWAWLDESNIVRLFESGDDPNQFPAYAPTASPGVVGGEKAGGVSGQDASTYPVAPGLCLFCLGRPSDCCPSSCLVVEGVKDSEGLA